MSPHTFSFIKSPFNEFYLNALRLNSSKLNAFKRNESKFQSSTEKLSNDKISSFSLRHPQPFSPVAVSHRRPLDSDFNRSSICPFLFFSFLFSFQALAVSRRRPSSPPCPGFRLRRGILCRRRQRNPSHRRIFRGDRHDFPSSRRLR